MRRSGWMAVVLLGLVLGGCTTAPGVESDDTLSDLSWMVGSWVRDDGSRVDEEHWTAARGGTMLGVNRTVVEGRTVFFEYLRIEDTPQGVVYLAGPMGRDPPTPFQLAETAERRVVFENTEHDFPQRVMYWREGDELHGRIEGVQNGEPRSSKWSWRRAARRGAW